MDSQVGSKFLRRFGEGFQGAVATPGEQDVEGNGDPIEFEQGARRYPVIDRRDVMGQRGCGPKATSKGAVETTGFPQPISELGGVAQAGPAQLLATSVVKRHAARDAPVPIRSVAEARPEFTAFAGVEVHWALPVPVSTATTNVPEAGRSSAIRAARAAVPCWSIISPNSAASGGRATPIATFR